MADNYPGQGRRKLGECREANLSFTPPPSPVPTPMQGHTQKEGDPRQRFGHQTLRNKAMLIMSVCMDFVQ